MVSLFTDRCSLSHFYAHKENEIYVSPPCNAAVFMFSFARALFTLLNAMSCKQILVIFKTHFLVSRENVEQKGRKISYFRAWMALEGDGRPQRLRSLCITCAEGRGKWSVEWFRKKTKSLFVGI
jgi:hypothetical protein